MSIIDGEGGITNYKDSKYAKTRLLANARANVLGIEENGFPSYIINVMTTPINPSSLIPKDLEIITHQSSTAAASERTPRSIP